MKWTSASVLMAHWSGDITIWGIADGQSFLNERTDLQCARAGGPRPLLWDDDYNEKPAYDGVMDALLGR